MSAWGAGRPEGNPLPKVWILKSCCHQPQQDKPRYPRWEAVKWFLLGKKPGSKAQVGSRSMLPF